MSATPNAAGFLLFAGLGVCGLAMPPETRLIPLEDRVRIEIDGRLFSEYFFRGAQGPYLYPILMPDGAGLTREFPIRGETGEWHYHPHHRSLWFTHGAVNECNFWWPDSPKAGAIINDGILEAKSGAVGILRAQSRWVSAEGKLICRDEQKISVRPIEEGILVDFEITLFAPTTAPVVFEDTKEGSMAIRIAPWMAMPHRFENSTQVVPGAGHALNSEGARDSAAWGQRAKWVDYFAPHKDKVYGIAIFDHPQNPRYPTWWVVRDYGLLAANPFGKHDFEKRGDANAGNFEMSPSGRVTFRYRFYFHTGDTDTAKVAQRFRDFAVVRY
jgi:hypothetical protein